MLLLYSAQFKWLIVPNKEKQVINLQEDVYKEE